MGSKWILLLGIMLGLVAAVLTYLKVGDEEVIVVTGQDFMKLTSDQNLAAGDRLLPELVSSVTVPLDFGEVQSVAVPYSVETVSWLTNNDVRVSRDIPAGSFVLHEHLIDDPADRFANIISEKGRAVSIPVSEITSVSFFVEPGSRVDVLTTFSVASAPELNASTSSTGFAQQSSTATPINGADGAFSTIDQRVVTRTIMQNMLVLAVGQATSRNAYLNSRRGYGAITLDVTPEEAEMLTFLMSQSQGGFNLVLRNPINMEDQEIDEVDWDTVSNQK